MSGNSSVKGSQLTRSAASPMRRTGSMIGRFPSRVMMASVPRQLELLRDEDGLVPIVTEHSNMTWSGGGLRHGGGLR